MTGGRVRPGHELYIREHDQGWEVGPADEQATPHGDDDTRTIAIEALEERGISSEQTFFAIVAGLEALEMPDVPAEPPPAADEAGAEPPIAQGDASERTKMVQPRREAEDEPDFEGDAERLRAYYDDAARLDDQLEQHRLRALARTREFYWNARRYRAEFDRLSAARHIRKGRIETRVLRWFLKVGNRNSRSNVNRWADALLWLSNHTGGSSVDTAVEMATSAGGLTAIADIEHAARSDARKAGQAVACEDIEPPTLADELDTMVATREPMSQDQHCTKERVVLYLAHERRDRPPELYGPIVNEPLIRRALKLLP